MSLTWQDPPAKVHSLVAWADDAATLRTRPRKWAFLTERSTRHGATSLASAINTGQLKAFRPAGDFEACARHGAVWARYLGDGGLPT